MKVKPGGIILSFDDIFIVEWYNICGLLARYNIKATFYVSNMDRLTNAEWEMLRNMRASGHCISHHGYRHLRAGVAGMDPNSPDNPRLKGAPFYKTMEEFVALDITPGLLAMASNDLFPRHYSYPWGNRTEESDLALLKIFKSLRKGGLPHFNPQNPPRVWGSVDFGKNESVQYGGNESKVSYVNKGDIVGVHMHRPIEKRIIWLAEYAQEYGAKFYTPEDIFS